MWMTCCEGQFEQQFDIVKSYWLQIDPLGLTVHYNGGGVGVGGNLGVFQPMFQDLYKTGKNMEQ